MAHLKTVAGVSLMLAGHAALGYHVHLLMFWPVRDAIAQSAPKPESEGKIVIVSGPVLSQDMLDDPDHLWPRPMVVLSRVVERPYRDSDNDLRWSLEQGGPIPSKQWLAKEARVGELRLDPAEMQWSSLPALSLDSEMVRHQKQPGVTKARWDRELGVLYTTSDEIQGYETAMDRPSGPLAVTALVTFRGIRAGDVITAVGRQKNGALVPFQYGKDRDKALLVAPGKLTAAELADAQVSARAMPVGGELIASSVAALGGLVLVFKAPAGTGLWLIWGGLGHIIGAIAGFGWREAVAPFLLTAGAAGAYVVTILIARTFVEPWLPLGAWLCVLAALVVIIRYRMNEVTVMELEDV